MTDAYDQLHPGLQYHLANTLRWGGLRPTQEAAVGPVLRGEDCIVLAPTAGGKTEAAAFPLLTRMAEEGWEGLSVLYVCPLKALLNNLQPRLDTYAQWLGRSAALWHGDVGQPARQRILSSRPDILLTTPESLEAMLVSTKVDPRLFFAGLRAVVVDEIHAFAGDDRGWHLLAVLERLSRVADRPLQRIGLSATVGNPEFLSKWVQGSFDDRPRKVVAPETSAGQVPDITVDFVHSISNAAKVISALHAGEKRLVFVDSRRRAEELGAALRNNGITTFLSHSSLSAAERRRSEQAFADERDTVIVATSTLELGIDIGDLDRVIQIGSPRTVASFLQRLGRTGRRSDTSRNCLFLCIDDDELLLSTGMLLAWSKGWVEPIQPPSSPRHIAAQQLLAATLQEHRLGRSTWKKWWGSLPIFDEHADAIFDHLVQNGYLDADGDLVHIGPEAERRFGHRYFSELTAVFSAPPEFSVIAGRNDVGTVGTELLVGKVEGPRTLLLAGRSWQVTHVDWKRRKVWVDPVDSGGKAQWSGLPSGIGFMVARSMREVVMGAEPPGISLTTRAKDQLRDLRASLAPTVNARGFVVHLPTETAGRWFSWAGTAANRTLVASLPSVIETRQRVDERSVRLLPGVTPEQIAAAIANVQWQDPAVDKGALSGLKFSAALPEQLARETLGVRLGDRESAQIAASDKRVIGRWDGE
ncbi:ATP-dependent helicase [Rhodococcoides trifolii]|uniref:ATP-dependent helicase n=1 Tax=Rhodococcoides trifolii TaxID=908250 RepID=A0A917CXU5_9NOCA|nr:DEAD/DEAH box helicase [Rhodococcus trifolii]GGF99343.1 ATP-dependent helicase [Rhodococcus trifolii]